MFQIHVLTAVCRCHACSGGAWAIGRSGLFFSLYFIFISILFLITLVFWCLFFQCLFFVRSKKIAPPLRAWIIFFGVLKIRLSEKASGKPRALARGRALSADFYDIQQNNPPLRKFFLFSPTC